MLYPLSFLHFFFFSGLLLLGDILTRLMESLIFVLGGCGTWDFTFWLFADDLFERVFGRSWPGGTRGIRVVLTNSFLLFFFELSEAEAGLWLRNSGFENLLIGLRALQLHCVEHTALHFCLPLCLLLKNSVPGFLDIHKYYKAISYNTIQYLIIHLIPYIHPISYNTVLPL